MWSLLTTSKWCCNVCRPGGSHKASRVGFRGEGELYTLISPHFTAQLPELHTRILLCSLSVRECAAARGLSGSRAAHLCVHRGSRVSSTEILTCAISVAISMWSKIRGAHHCLVPRNRTSEKDVQKITLWDLWSLIFTSRHSDTLQEDAWLLRRNYSSELRCRENSCKLLL